MTKAEAAKYRAEYYQKNKKKVAKQGIVYRKANKEDIVKKKAAYYKANKEKIAEAGAKKYRDNKEKILKQSKAHREINKEKLAKRSAIYRKNNKTKIAEKGAKYYRNNKEKIDLQKAVYQKLNKEKIAKQRTAYRKANKKKIAKADKLYSKKNRDAIVVRTLAYRKKNKDRLAVNALRLRNKNVSFDTYAQQLSWFKKVRRCPDNKNNLQVKCDLCRKWFSPTSGQVNQCKKAINGKGHGYGELYCSDGCKQTCPVFRKIKYRKGEAPIQKRPGQKEWRDRVIVCSEYACERCGKVLNEKDLTAHHIKPVVQHPLESMDVDNGMALCKDCHAVIHSEKGCRPVDLRCSE